MSDHENKEKPTRSQQQRIMTGRGLKKLSAKPLRKAPNSGVGGRKPGPGGRPPVPSSAAADEEDDDEPNSFTVETVSKDCEGSM